MRGGSDGWDEVRQKNVTFFPPLHTCGVAAERVMIKGGEKKACGV